MTVAPAIAVYLGTSEQTVTAFLTAVLTFALAVLDAKYPNTFTQTVEPPSKPTYNGDIFDNDAPLNPEYESDDDDSC